jgi:HEAT repeat protein
MGLADSLAILTTLPPEHQVPLLEAALREPYAEIQIPALELLSDPRGLRRADLVVLHFGGLLPSARERLLARAPEFREAAREETRSSREAARKAGYEVLAALDPREAPAHLLRGLADPSPGVRESVTERLEAIAHQYYYHLIAARLHGDEQSRAYLREHQGVLQEVLGTMLRSYTAHGKRIFLDIAIESGPELYPLVSELLQARADPGFYTAFVHALSQAVSESAVELIIQLWMDGRPRLQDAAVDVFRLRRDPGFPALLATLFAKMPPERLASLAHRTKDLPWWPAVEACPDIDPFTAQRLIEFIARSGLEPRRRNSFILSFRASAYPDVRARVLATLQVLESPDLLSLAQGFLQDPSDEVKLAAARTIIGINPAEKTRLLLPLLNAASEDVRRVAMREVASASFERYLRAFDRLDPATRESAAKALAKIDPRIAERLGGEIAALDPERRLRALKVVDYVDAETELRPNLLALMADPDRRVRATALKIVQLTKDADGMALLVNALGDPDRRVRANAIEAFEDSGDPRSAPLLQPFLRDPDNRVRANAAKALWNLGHDEGRSALQAMIRDERELMRLSAVWAIGEVRFPGAVDVLLQRVENEPSPQVRAKIAEVLTRLTQEGGEVPR